MTRLFARDNWPAGLARPTATDVSPVADLDAVIPAAMCRGHLVCGVCLRAFRDGDGHRSDCAHGLPYLEPCPFCDDGSHR